MGFGTDTAIPKACLLYLYVCLLVGSKFQISLNSKRRQADPTPTPTATPTCSTPNVSVNAIFHELTLFSVASARQCYCNSDGLTLCTDASVKAELDAAAAEGGGAITNIQLESGGILKVLPGQESAVDEANGVTYTLTWAQDDTGAISVRFWGFPFEIYYVRYES